MFLTVLKKDLLVELRSKEIVISMIAFGVSVILLYSFSFNQSPETFSIFSAGLLWMVFLFISVLGLHRSFSLEKEFDAMGLMLSAPVDRSYIFLSKWLSGLAFLLVSQSVIVPLFWLFLHLPIPGNLGGWIGLFILSDLGITSIGSLVSGITMRARMGEILLPILLFPLVSPLLIAAVRSTHALMNNQDFGEWRIWIQLMTTFVVAFALMGYVIFDHVSEQ
ncbi:MAG: heme exporter protein CcmB [Candidatus Neomarinimicrobiota bacterium]